MSLYIPRLSRATSDYLQLPPKEAAAALKVIEECLYDSRTTDFAYQLLISQASKEPYSPFLVQKSVNFIRKYLSKFRPSLETLLCISQFCIGALHTFGSGTAHERKDLQRSLHFLQSLVDHALSESPKDSATSQASDDSKSSLKPSYSLQRAKSWESNPPNGGLGGGESENGDFIPLSGPHNSARILNSFGGGSSLSSENLQSCIKRTKTPVIDPSYSTKRLEPVVSKGLSSNFMWNNGSSSHIHDFQLHRRSRSDNFADKFIQEMQFFRPPHIWMNHGLSRTHSETEGGEGWLNITNMKGLMCLEHLWTVLDYQNGLGSSEKWRSGGSHSRGTPSVGSAPLFQYKSYKEQESLNLDSREVAIIVNTVCGLQDVNDHSIWGDNQASEIWDSASDAKPIGEACVTILVKLIMDMYLNNGPGLSFVLVLQMLQRSVMNPLPSVRSRAFDLVYNLALHSTMMANTSDGSFFEKNKHTVEKRREVGSRSSRDFDKMLTAHPPPPKLHTLNEESENHPEQEATVLQMLNWVRSLLFALMVLITELDEQDVQVWTAAVGCFLHLATDDGDFLWSVVQNFPFSVIQKILRKCVQAGWSDEVYVRFIRLFVKLAYMPSDQGERIVNEVRILQGGGLEEIFFHLRIVRSMEAASWLLQLSIDYVSQTTNCNQDALSPLLANLLSPSIVDVIVSRCRHGGKGIGETLHVALQNCIIEKNAAQDSPKNPVHYRHRTQSSLLSSETTGSVTPGLEPEAMEAWRSVLNKLDAFLCQPIDNLSLIQRIGRPHQVAKNEDITNWDLLQEVMGSFTMQDRICGIHWIKEYCMANLESYLKHKDQKNLSLLPWPSSPDKLSLSKVLEHWLRAGVASDEDIGCELSRLIDEFISHLVSLESPKDSLLEFENDHQCSPTFPLQIGKILFQTLESGLKWIKMLPVHARRFPLLSMSYHVCQVVHASQLYGDVSTTPPSDGILSLPGPFVYNDYIFGTSTVYINVLRLAPIDFLLDLIATLEVFCPVYNKRESIDDIGFFGRPGCQNCAKNDQNGLPWTDTISDIRSALTLLLLHRCSMDSTGKKRLESICRSLLEDEDVRVQYLSSRYLLKFVMEEKSSACRAALRQFVAKAQQMNNERLVDNPYLQVKHMLESEK